MGLILHSPCNSSHKHSHGRSSSNSSETQGNINVRAAVIHVLGDFIQSVGVLVAALIIKLNPDAKIADPICTFIFSIIVIFTTKNVVRDTINVLMESVPFTVNYDTVMDLLNNIDGVRHVHSLHIWALTTNKIALTVHLAVDKFCDNEEILKTATKTIRTKFDIAHMTVQIEKYKSDIIGDCTECQVPKK